MNVAPTLHWKELECNLENSKEFDGSKENVY
jgi:hypothetical protein